MFNLATGRNAHGRNNAMDVGMQTQVLSPGMEHAHGARFSQLIITRFMFDFDWLYLAEDCFI